MIEHEFKTTLAQPPEEVFDFLVDFRNEPQWEPNCQSVEKTSDGPIDQGTTFSAKVKGVGRIRSEIVEYQRPAHFATHDQAFAMDGGVDFRFAPKDGGTEVSVGLQMRPRGPMRLIEPLMRPKMKRMLDEMPENLRRGIESRA